MTTGPVLLEIQTNDGPNITERRFPGDMLIVDLKSRLELITGASAATMELAFSDTLGGMIINADDSKSIGDYLLPGGDMRLRLYVKDSQAMKLDDLSSVPKFVLSDEEYEKRTESVRAFKMKHNLGRFSASNKESEFENKEIIKDIKVGNRCEVTVKNLPPRRGQVMYVGQLGNKTGYFVGVKYDEPYGKNDGTFENHRYFECPPNYGSFVRPNDVKVGDFPEEEINFDD